MNDLWEMLYNIINDEYIIPSYNNQILLSETKVNETCSIKVKKKGKTLILKLDDETDLFPFFKNIQSLKEMNDYIVFHNYDNKIRLFLFELKSGNPGKAKSQIFAGRIFSEFILATANRMAKTNFHLHKINRVIVNKKIQRKTRTNARSENIEFNYVKYGQTFNLNAHLR